MSQITSAMNTLYLPIATLIYYVLPYLLDNSNMVSGFLINHNINNMHYLQIKKNNYPKLNWYTMEFRVNDSKQ